MSSHGNLPVPGLMVRGRRGSAGRASTVWQAPTIMLAVYQHVHPGMGRQAADRFAALLEG